MNKILAVVFFFISIASLNAQQLNEFSTDHDKFMKELDQFLTSGKMEENVQAMDNFQKLVKDNKISASWLDKVIAMANVMRGHLMAPSPHFVAYINAVSATVKAGATDSQFNEWNETLGFIIDDQKKGDNSNFLKFVDFIYAFYSQNALNVTSAKIWKVDATAYKLDYTEGKLSVSFPQTTLTGSVRGDSIKVLQTVGTYFPFENKWVGKSGKVDWSRVGFDPGKTYCTFKDYSINLANFNYSIDTVLFYDYEYLKQPLKGKMTDKLVSGGDSTNMTYPRFDSYEEGVTLKDVAPNVTYTGGFDLHGSKVLGSGTADNKAMLTFYAKDGKTPVLTARSQNVSIKKGEELSAERAEVSIYFGTDSIYHPQLTLVYKVKKHEMRLLRGETGLGQAKFTDSYHNDEFQTDAIFWNMDSSILNLKILSGVGKKPGVYESVNYFNKELMRKTQGVSSVEPLSVLKRLYEKTGSRDISVLDYAHALDPNLKEGEVKTLLYDLVANGFIAYNEDLGIVTIKDKAINYVLAKAKRIDYDIITIKSAPQSGNDYIDLKSSDIDLKGVFEVPISDTAYVYFRPKDNSISLQKDRNMEFDGLVYAGRMDMIGEKFKFQYLPFTIDLTKVDTMRINIPDSNKVDEYGEPILKPMKSKVEGIKGLLEIDAPINKSGRTRLPQFPRLYSKEKSYIYYDDPAIAKGAYGRKSFFFELEPFRLDSLNNFSPDIINWKGKLVSGGIFPDIKDSVHLQTDASLGFKSETPPGGYDLYKGKGKYYGKFELNYSGLSGSGSISHSTAFFATNDVRLYPDSMRATTDSFFIKKTFDGVKTPNVVGNSDMVFWKPVSDSMHISMNAADKPFSMYDDSATTFKGDLLLTDKGLYGDGMLDWDLATLTSKDFSFRTMDLSADTAALNIKTTGDRVSFKTPNVSAKVDFKTRIGDFKSNLHNIPTDFSYNQYQTAINEFKWYMDEKILDFKAPAAGPGEYFTSTRPEQKGLKFLGKRATYNLVSSVLRIEQVPEIKVADASVVPDSGVVIIEAEAKMHQLRNAVIYADTITKVHRFDSAIVDIFSKEQLKGTGTYHYATKGIKEDIDFGDISTTKETLGKRKKEHDIWQLVAKANIDEKDNFVIYPGVAFNGQATVLSVDPLVNFKGFAKLDLKQPKANPTAFFIDQDVDPKTLSLNYAEVTKDPNNNKLSAGLHISPVPDAPGMYATLLSAKRSNTDLTVFKTSGIVTQLPDGEYMFGDSLKIKQNNLRGNVIKYNDKTGFIKAEGKFDLGTNFGIIKTAAAGSAETLLDSGKYKLNLTFAIDPRMNDKMQERFEFYMVNDNADQPDINYDNDKSRKAITELCDEKDDKKTLDDFIKTAAFNKRPKDLDENIVFTDVNFVFDPDDISLRSVGKIGVAMVGKKVVNKKLDGYIELQYKGGADIFTIYIQTGTKGWFYFNYRPGTLAVISSYSDLNNQLIAVPADKRKIKGEKNRFYVYAPGSPLDEQDFVDYMKDRANGVSRPHPEMHAPTEEIPMAGDTSGLNEMPGDTGVAPVNQQQEEINQIQDMKGTSGGILSGPPPDRVKPAEQNTDTVKTQEQMQEQKQQDEINNVEQMKGAGDGGILSGPPPDRNKPNVDTTASQAPAQQTPQPDTTVASPKDEIKQEPPKQVAAPTVTPPVQQPAKQDSVAPAPKEEIKSETPKSDVTPSAAEPAKQDAPAATQQTPPVAEPPAEAPKADTTQPKPASDSIPVGQPH